MSKQEVSLNSLNIHKVPSLSLWKEQYNAANGINENDLVIISPQNLEDGVFYDLKDYDLYEKTGSSVIDLTNTTWIFNDDSLPYEILSSEKNISFTSNNKNYIAIDYGPAIASINAMIYRYGSESNDTDMALSGSSWTDENYKTIYITGGEDITDIEFINWLQSNATAQGTLNNITVSITSRELWRKNAPPSGTDYTKIGSALDLIQGPTIKSITIPTTGWRGPDPYYKTITSLITGYTITNKSKFDIQVDSTTINQLMEDGVQALYINNDNKVVKIYAIGAAPPTQSITIQISIQETI